LRDLRIFLFLGEDTVDFIEFLRYLDPNRTYNVMYLGENSREINNKYGGKVLPGGKKLIVFGKNTEISRMFYREGDANYSVEFDHEMSMEYLTKIMPVIGSMTLKEMCSMGFPLFEKVLDVQIMHGKIYSTEMPKMVKKGVPFLINGMVKSMYDDRGYPKNHYVVEKDCGEMTMVTVKTEGVLNYKCDSYHCYRFPGVDGGHYHTIRVGEKFEDSRGSVMGIKHSLLSRLPRVVSRAKIIESFKYSVSEEDLVEYMDLMEFHPRVKKYKHWFLIEGSKNDLDPCDMRLLADEAKAEGLCPGDYLNLMFTVEFFWEINSVNNLFEKPYVYKVVVGEDDRWFVDVRKYAESVGDRNFLKMKGLTPDDGGRNSNDICVWKEGGYSWPVYYYGK